MAIKPRLIERRAKPSGRWDYFGVGYVLGTITTALTILVIRYWVIGVI